MKISKKIIIINLVIILTFIVMFFVILTMQYKQYKENLNKVVNNIVNEVAQNYPNVQEEELIKILQSSNKKDEILKKYGYDNESIYVVSIEKAKNINIMVDIIFLAIFGITLYTFYYICVKKEKNEIEEINKYLKEINKKNYTLQIEKNEEKMLSKFRNEIYKTTVLLKETAEISQKEKEQLSNSLADISHQLKTPLTSIRIMLDNIQENPNMDSKIREEFIKDISVQIDWVNSLVISILKLAKFDSGTIKMNNKRINVKELLENVNSNLSILLEIKNIEILLNVEEKANFTGDYKWQLEAITNIVKNAIEHSYENSKIYITVENTNLFLKIQIRDEGKGIEKAEIKHIFERFYKSNNASENSIGIGLSLAKTIIEKNNGYIQAESETNKGTTFIIKYIK